MLTCCFRSPPCIYNLDHVVRKGREVVLDSTGDQWTRSYGSRHLSIRQLNIVNGVQMSITLLASSFLLLTRAPYRIAALCCGDFIWAGYRQAERNWNLERQAWSLTNSTKTLPGKFAFCRELTIQSLKQLTKNIVKAVTCPLAAVALFFSALYGLLINLHDGRMFISKIENAWSRDEMYIDDSSKTSRFLSSCNLILGDYIAPFFQTRRVWIKRNIYANLTNYKRDHVCSKIRKILVTLQQEEQWMQKEGVDTKHIITFFKKQLDQPHRKISNICEKYEELLTKIKKLMLAIISQQNARNECSEDEETLFKLIEKFNKPIQMTFGKAPEKALQRVSKDYLKTISEEDFKTLSTLQGNGSVVEPNFDD